VAKDEGLSVKRVVMFSGGVASWAAAKRTVAQHGTDETVLLFTDTKIEDEDLYATLRASAENVGAPLEIIADGRTPWEVFRAERMLGNSRIDPCSKILKRELARKWLKANAPGATVVVGINWDEINRLDAITGRYGALGHAVEAPLCQSPLLSKTELFRWWQDSGLKQPGLYQLGFSHNNCGGFCIKAGQGHFARLLKALPERYRYHEQQERDFRALDWQRRGDSVGRGGRHQAAPDTHDAARTHRGWAATRHVRHWRLWLFRGGR
jgi:3'-phosphoadenosine 5'-phosphosulfate sulfotransferase (PAPS reductase)/FAD synthetase